MPEKLNLKNKNEDINNSFKVSVETGLSFHDVLDLAKKGELIHQTPHVGNNSIDILAKMKGSAGLNNMLFHLYELNMSRKDTLFHPSLIKHFDNQKNQKIFDKDILMTHFPKELKDIHMEKLYELFPNTNIQTTSEIIKNDQDFYNQYYNTLTDKIFDLGLVKRWVNKEGIVSDKQPKSKIELKQNTFLISKKDEGFLIPVEVDIVLETILQTQNFKHNKVYHISGPVMYQYINGMKDKLEEMYQVLKNKYDLPNIELAIVPLADTKFVSHKENYHIIEEYFDLDKKYKRLNFELESKMVDVPDSKKGKIAKEFKPEIQEAKEELQAFLYDYYKQIFYNKLTDSFYTQYDFKSVSDIIAHPDNFEYTAKEFSKIIKESRKELGVYIKSTKNPYKWN